MKKLLLGLVLVGACSRWSVGDLGLGGLSPGGAGADELQPST